MAVQPVNVPTSRWTCSFVNNMPDAAFKATERQFLNLLSAGAGHDIIEVRRHTMSGVVRGEEMAEYIARNYLPLSTIRESPTDIVVVTGSNPVEPRIEHEPYFAELQELLEWSILNVASMLLSCLAAHAALLSFDGIARERLDLKCTGVFPQRVDRTHPLGIGMRPEVVMPHSRLNTSDANLMRLRGYAIPIESPEVGWSVASKKVGRCEVLLIQAHPEYEPASLLREYRRDAYRYVTGERSERPALPVNCVDPQDWPDLKSLHAALTPSKKGVTLLEDYPFEEVGDRSPWRWRDDAHQLYANWLSEIKNEKGGTNAR